MKLCYFDAFSGISGDMTVGALLHAGADPAQLLPALDSLGTGATFRFETTRRGGIAAGKFTVDGGEQKKHRHLSHILRMIEGSSFPDRAKQNAIAVFQRLGEAEASVHGTPVEKVHFHEVGAADSIADIAGACLALDLLGVEQIYCSALNVGSGTVNTEHGLLPVPAPATAALLAGKPIYSSGPAVELTTPTGAAIAVTLAQQFGSLPPMRIERTGFGAGDRDFPGQANVLRVLIGEASTAVEAAAVAVIEANIDDSTPELLGYVLELLLERGALDVTLSPLQMKKNRPGVLLRAIARPEDRETLAALVLEETTTLGVRIYPAERRVQERRIVEVETPHGTVRVKVAADGSFAPEYEDCRRIARSAGLPLKNVVAEAGRLYLQSTRV
jgi:uncharacterized protein (TIGR00299 family) protein